MSCFFQSVFFLSLCTPIPPKPLEVFLFFFRLKKILVFNVLTFHWLVARFGFNSSLREYFSLHQVISHREEENNRYGRRERHQSQQPPPAPIESIIGPFPTIIHISRTLGTEVSQHRSPTRQPPYILMMSGRIRGQT